MKPKFGKQFDLPRMARIIVLRGCGFLQEEVASMTGVSQQTVSRYCLEARRVAENTSETNLVRWAAAMVDLANEVEE